MKKTFSAASLFILLSAGFAAASETAAAAAGHGASPVSGPTAEESLARLFEGNQRFVKGGSVHPDATVERRNSLASGQKPFAAVLACSDSRVPPELLFDQGLGAIFTVRVAGNVAGPSEQGSIEYAAEHLGTPLIMVLGHTGCGAVKGASAGGQVEGQLASVLKCIEPAVKNVKGRGVKGGELVPAVVEENVRLNAMTLLRKNAVIRRLAGEGRVKVAAAVYDLATGEVRLLDLESELLAERKAKTAALRGLLRKFKDSYLEDGEKNRLISGVTELLPELNQ